MLRKSTTLQLDLFRDRSADPLGRLHTDLRLPRRRKGQRNSTFADIITAARSVADLWDAIRDDSPRFTPNECANYFTAAGYELDRSNSALAHELPCSESSLDLIRRLPYRPAVSEMPHSKA